MPDKYLLVKRCLGYLTKPDVTAAPFEVIVAPSQNMLINDQELVETRGGYTLYGAAGSGTAKVESAYDWKTSSNTVISLRGNDDELEFYAGTIGGVAFNAWKRLEASWTAVDFDFTTYWDTAEGAEGIDLLLFVVGNDKIYDWSGGLASLKSATSNTITKNGTTTWAQERFLIAGTRKVNINGTIYTYTGGETTTTLTGVTGDPSGEAADSLVFQEIRTNDNQPADGVVNDIIGNSENHIFVGSNTNREVYVSKNTSFTTFTFSSPRVPGEGALLVLDGVSRAFVPLDREMAISSGKDDWYITEFEQIEVNAVLSETLKIKKLKTAPGLAAQSQDLVTPYGDGFMFVSFEPALRYFNSAAELESQLTTLSDPIKSDFDAEDFTGGHLVSLGNRAYLSAPVNDKVYILETKQTERGLRRFWQPPQILPIQKFAIVSNLIYGHSNALNETYKLFDNTNDNGNSFAAKAAFSYRNYQARDRMKECDEVISEGYITANTKITLNLNFDFGGSTQQYEKEIDGASDAIIFEPLGSGSLGDNPLGDSPLGDEPEVSTDIPKFRVIHDFGAKDFFEIQFIYSTDAKDARWKLLSHGANVRFSENIPVSIKQ